MISEKPKKCGKKSPKDCDPKPQDEPQPRDPQMPQGPRTEGSTSINIVSVNDTILKRFDKEMVEKINTSSQIEKVLETPENITSDILTILEDQKKTLVTKAHTDKLMYIAKTGRIIHEYESILKLPMMSSVISPDHQKKDKLIQDYIRIVKDLVKSKQWNEISINYTSSEPSSCTSCENDENDRFEVDEYNRRVCTVCGTQQKMVEICVNHGEYARSNVVGKFVYNRILHFQDCIKQYQGKQNCQIPQKLYDELDAKFNAYRILVDSDNKHIRYSKVTKDLITLFLKELKYTKHYENVNLIFHTLTGKKQDDISHLEHQLIEDFRELVALYDKTHGKDKEEELDRKNFINVQYILFQFLRRHNHPCKIEDFTILKTIDRRLFHDQICSRLFEKLGWNFTPTF
jgi:hypothetical protein